MLGTALNLRSNHTAPVLSLRQQLQRAAEQSHFQWRPFRREAKGLIPNSWSGWAGKPHAGPPKRQTESSTERRGQRVPIRILTCVESRLGADNVGGGGWDGGGVGMSRYLNNRRRLI